MSSRKNMNINEKSEFKHLTAFILIILAESAQSPSCIRNTLLKDFPGFTREMSTIYRCLSSLEKEGFTQIEWELPQDGAAKKIYHLTDAGRIYLEEWKKDIQIRKANFETFLEKFEALPK